MSVLFPEIPISFWKPAHLTGAFVTIGEVSSRAVGSPARPAVNWLLGIWVVGFVVACVPLFVGSISAWRMTRRAAPFQDTTVAGKTEVLVSDELPIPVTCGLVRPRIMLPRSAENWSRSRMEAVLLHEVAHVKRRDLLAQVAAHFVSALWWFQPLVWVLRRRLRAESEFACDAEAIRNGFRSSEYAAELLGVARSVGGDWRLSSSAIGMVRSGDLEERLRAVLEPRVAVFRRSRIYVVGFVLGAASIAASAVSLGGNQNSEEQGDSIMKRTIISALLTSAGLSASTVGGYIHDSNGAAVADAKVSIYAPDSAARQEVMTSSDGKFSLSGTEPGQYILRVEKPGFASIFRVFDLKADSSQEREFTMSNEGAANGGR